MKRHLVKTKDNSYTLFVPELDEHYHSIHGAVQEAEHVFIQAGMLPVAQKKKQFSVLEIGFGTGLNALLTCLSADLHQLEVSYTGLEKYPLQSEEYQKLGYTDVLPQHYPQNKTGPLFETLHQVPWAQYHTIRPGFQLRKLQTDFKNFSEQAAFDLIYYDAFAPSAQANLWTVTRFTSMYKALKTDGVLVTYCVKGEVRRNMQAAGFQVEKLPGPPGKREMARAWKKQCTPGPFKFPCC